jgi:hypothetical protein
MLTKKEKVLFHLFIKDAEDEISNRGCNDVSEALWADWTKDERKQFVKDYHDYNGDPEEYDSDRLNLPDYAIFGFLSHKFNEEDADEKKYAVLVYFNGDIVEQRVSDDESYIKDQVDILRGIYYGDECTIWSGSLKIVK